jgi:hypothetical protein
MAMVFAQTTGIEVRIIDYLEDTGQGLAHYAKRLAERSYRYQEHILPHDAEQRELGTGKTRLEMLRAMSLGALRVLPNLPITDGIEQARQLLARAYIDQDRCRPLLKSLEHYRTDWLESRKTFALRPHYDWASAGADAFRYLALGLRTTTLRPPPPGECALRELQLHHPRPRRRRPRAGLGPAVTPLWRPASWHLAIPSTAPPKRAALLVVCLAPRKRETLTRSTSHPASVEEAPILLRL